MVVCVTCYPLKKNKDGRGIQISVCSYIYKLSNNNLKSKVITIVSSREREGKKGKHFKDTCLVQFKHITIEEKKSNH